MFPYWPRMKLASFQCLHFQLSYFQSEKTVFSSVIFNYSKLRVQHVSSVNPSESYKVKKNEMTMHVDGNKIILLP